MVENQTECSILEQRSLIKFLVTDMCKPWDIYRRMCDEYRETYFNQNSLYKWAKNGFATSSPSQKDSPWSGNTLW